MGVEVSPIENEMTQILNDSVEAWSNNDEVKEEIVTDAIVEDKEESTDEVEETETTEDASEDEVEDEATEEAVDEEEIDDKEIKLADDLRGVFNKDYINLLESIEDPDLRSKFIDEGKKVRSELDRKRLELGEGKKTLEQDKQLYANYKGFDELYQRDPKEAIKSLAKHSNIDLNTMVDRPTVQEEVEDDYLLPEERETRDKLKTLEQELNQLKNQRQQQEHISAKEEVLNFSNAKDSEGNLKHPHFDRVKKDMALFFNDSNPDMTMELAYKKATLLDEELVSKRDEDILKKAELKRKEQVEKAKKLKKQSVRSSKVNSTISDPHKNLEKLVGDYYGS